MIDNILYYLIVFHYKKLFSVIPIFSLKKQKLNNWRKDLYS